MAAVIPAGGETRQGWPPTITREMMDEQIELLADQPRPADEGRPNQTMFVHPSAPDPGRGLTPGVRVMLEVLKPGEETMPSGTTPRR
ncbi:MAG: hypothetical protein R3E86_00445 [Pseudomonadales bacterium]